MADTYVEPPANTASGNKVDCEDLGGGLKRQRAILKHPTTPYHKPLAAGTNAAVIKAAPAHVWSIDVGSRAAYPIAVHLYNQVGVPNVGVDVPQRTVDVQAGIPRTIAPPGGISFSAGLAIAVTKGIADTAVDAVALNDGVVDIDYQ